MVKSTSTCSASFAGEMANFPQGPSNGSALARVRLNTTNEFPCFCRFAAMRLPIMPRPMNPIFIFFLSSGCGDQFWFINIVSVDLVDFLIRKAKSCRIHITFYLLGAARTDNGSGYGWISQGPSDGNLPRWALNSFSHFPQALDQGEISREPRLLKLDVATAPIARRKIGRAFSRHGARQQTGGHRRINDHANPVGSTIR